MIETSRPINNLNEQLQQYMYQLESEVGRSGRTLHQIVTEYLSLKNRCATLVKDLDKFEIEEVENTTPEQFQKNIRLVRSLQALQASVLVGFKSLNDHPWRGFAHSDHQLEATDSFIRTIRFVSIQLSKFWVEIQSFPLFLNGLPNLSVREIDSIFQWLKSCPSWKDAVPQPRVIPALTQADSRKILFDFVRDVKSIRILQEKIKSQQSAEFLSSNLIQSGFELLTLGVQLVKRYELGTCVRADLVQKVEDAKKRLSQAKQVQDFFLKIGEQKGFPRVGTPHEAKYLFQAIECLRTVPKVLLPWRSPRILGAPQLIRIQAWSDRAKPILELRQKVDSFFQLKLETNSEKLRDLSVRLTSSGILRRFNASYRDALSTYRSLIRPEILSQKRLKETPLQMSERLLEWASYLEQVELFEGNSELKSIFGTQFKGLSTEFNRAVEANLWATQIRNQFEVLDDPFSNQMVDVIFASSEQAVNKVVTLAGSMGAEVLKVLNEQSEYLVKDRSFAEIESLESSKLSDLSTLLNTITRLGIPSDVFLISLENLSLMTEEVIFLTRRVELSEELKAWFRSAYRGVETDLSIIEKGLAYVQFMENAAIPESLRASFLSVHGPQRLEETRGLMTTALSSLNAAQEYLDKFDSVTQGQLRDLVHGPIPELLAKIQIALKNPALLPDWIDYLRCEKDLKESGLGPFLIFVEEIGGFSHPLDLVYEVAYTISLLKKVVGNSALGEGLNQSFFH